MGPNGVRPCKFLSSSSRLAVTHPLEHFARQKNRDMPPDLDIYVVSRARNGRQLSDSCAFSLLRRKDSSFNEFAEISKLVDLRTAWANIQRDDGNRSLIGAMPVFRNKSVHQNLIETHCYLCQQSHILPPFPGLQVSFIPPDVIVLPPIKNFLVIPFERAEDRV